MKFALQRVGALLMALILLAASFGSFPLTASAEENKKTDAYVLNYAPGDLTVDYGYNQPSMYTTPFMVEHHITDENWNHFLSGTCHPVIFNLINTTKLASGGDGAYASIGAYSADASAGMQENVAYRRINLEDSTYYAGSSAGKIRAVVLNAYPYKDISAIQTGANTWLRAQGLPEIVDLQSGEAILAAQTAIWKLANGDHYTIDANYAGREDLPESSLASVIYPDNAYQEETKNTEQNIKSLNDYLCNLDAVAPQYDAVSESSIENPVYTAVKEADGTYTITVTASINTSVGESDSLTLSATCGDQIQNQVIANADNYRFTFEKMTERLEVKLEINGYQAGADVYLFDADGDRDASQSLVGYDESILPVHGEMTVTPDRILNIFTSTSEEDGSIPLSNIVFDIYKVATMEQVGDGAVIPSAEPTDEDIAKYQVKDNLIATLMTNVQGFAAYNFTENGQPDGIYMIAEQFNAAITGAVKPFYIVVPGTTADGSGYSYTLNINPKNVTETGPDIRKDVTGVGNNSDTFDIGESHTWIIRGDVPAGIGSARKYVITDVIDHRLTYEKGSPVVKLCTRAGTETILEADKHYTLAEGAAKDGDYVVDRFTVSLTAEGMSYVAANLGSGEVKPEIRVCFNAVINKNASMGSTIPNDAHLDYTNCAGVDYHVDSDIPEVHTGGINILNADKKEVPLEGAAFMIAREATQAELENETVIKEVLSVSGKDLAVVFVDFYAAADLRGEKVYEVTTDAHGKALLYGLAYGTYYLLETKAPAGYNLLPQPITVQINEVSHLTEADGWENTKGEIVDNTLHVINTKFVLPGTGGMGTTVFTVTGVLIIASACLLLLSNRKKRV